MGSTPFGAAGLALPSSHDKVLKGFTKPQIVFSMIDILGLCPSPLSELLLTQLLGTQHEVKMVQ
ncbi:uncharacterized protein PHALS_03563 [Plasmopara halstedii]|uniref:Uncharacterized protein n=1 Tax=Plasmopara halstedii TaxID=4781 RepID=A0A0P1AYF7_PLAHL|nr:uncharacterized protein PHALS_03563 [Plasmopara halstedii]CEG46889.1 hypothetical protein PHALS_03563 [Plasmopara halstedii]|eukprot:XP_024583258.1 hypothetical protein PHALS_03563 [Plasmopara halstedii]